MGTSEDTCASDRLNEDKATKPLATSSKSTAAGLSSAVN